MLDSFFFHICSFLKVRANGNVSLSDQMDACAEEKLHAFTDQPDSQMLLSPQDGVLNQAHFSPGTPGTASTSFLSLVAA